MEEFSTIITAAGAAKIAGLLAGGTLTLAAFAVGDSNGDYYEPDEAQTALVNEKWRGAITNITENPDDSTQSVVEVYIPPDVGGWWIREAALFTDDTPPVLFALAKVPAREKADPLSGSLIGMYIKLYIDANPTSIALGGAPGGPVYVDIEGSGKRCQISAKWDGVDDEGRDIWSLIPNTI